jgi:hypothetical protein
MVMARTICAAPGFADPSTPAHRNPQHHEARHDHGRREGPRRRRLMPWARAHGDAHSLALTRGLPKANGSEVAARRDMAIVHGWSSVPTLRESVLEPHTCASWEARQLALNPEGLMRLLGRCAHEGNALRDGLSLPALEEAQPAAARREALTRAPWCAEWCSPIRRERRLAHERGRTICSPAAPRHLKAPGDAPD